MKPLDVRLVQRSRAVRTHVVVSVVLGGLTAALIIATSWCIAQVVAKHFADEPIWALPWAIAGGFALRALMAWAHGRISERASVTVKEQLRTEVIEDLLDPRRQGQQPSSGRLVTLLGPGMDAFDGYIGRFLPQLALAVVVPSMIIVVVLFTDLLSAAIIAATLPLIGIFMALVGLLTRDKVERRWAAMERLGRHFADVLDGLVVLKIFGRRQEEGLAQVGDRHRVESMRALRLAFLSSLVLELFSTISVALVAVSIGLRVVEGNMELAPAMFVLLLAPEAYLPVRRVGMMFHDSSEGAEATVEVLDLLDHPRHTGSTPIDTAPMAIDIAGLVVRHQGRSHNALEVDRISVQPGEFVALTGPSGGGKSTLLDVLLGFTGVSEGTVTVGNCDLADVDIVSWRENLAWVRQNPTLISGTIASNVAMTESYDRDVVTDCLIAAGLEHFSPDRPVAEAGRDHSAGERRRVSLARALYRIRTTDAWLVLLDEPTAGLDHDRERHVLASLRQLGATIIVVAHRSETIAAADRIVTIGTRETAHA